MGQGRLDQGSPENQGEGCLMRPPDQTRQTGPARQWERPATSPFHRGVEGARGPGTDTACTDLPLGYGTLEPQKAAGRGEIGTAYAHEIRGGQPQAEKPLTSWPSLHLPCSFAM